MLCEYTSYFQWVFYQKLKNQIIKIQEFVVVGNCACYISTNLGKVYKNCEHLSIYILTSKVGVIIFEGKYCHHYHHLHFAETTLQG